MSKNNLVCNKLRQYFSENIKLSFVEEFLVIVITKEDLVYIFQRNLENTTFIAFSSDNSIDLKIAEEYCFKNIVAFSRGKNHSIARTRDGCVYCWGSNVLGQLGIDKEEYFGVLKPKLNQFLSDFQIIDICCGYNHSLALTNDGQVFEWGTYYCDGQVGKGDQAYKCIERRLPFKVMMSPFKFISEVIKVIAISCGRFHSLALTELGQIFSWGYPSYCNVNAKSPKLIKINVQITKICCGLDFSFLLSCDGDIYAFNGKNYKNLSHFDLNDRNVKFTDFSAIYYSSFLVALTENNVLVHWDIEEIRKYLNSEDYLVFSNIAQYESFDQFFEDKHQKSYKEISERLIDFEDSITENGKYEKHYEEIKSLGKGSYGEVFEVRTKYEGFVVAMKKLKFSDNDKEDLLKELKIFFEVCKLHNKRIANCYEAWLESQIKSYTLFIKMDLCDENLEKVIDQMKKDSKFFRNESLTLSGYYIASYIFVHILEGVNCLHQRSPQIIHRDLKPDNILVKIENNEVFVKIADFGLIAFHEFAERTQTHTQDKGHIRYAAPEVLNGNRYDTKADVYSLGIILQNLFEVDSEKEYRNDVNDSTLLGYKYLEIKDLLNRMINESPESRPHCTQIMHEHHLWSLDVDEFDPIKELDQLTEYENNSIIYTIFSNIGRKNGYSTYLRKPYNSSLDFSDSENSSQFSNEILKFNLRENYFNFNEYQNNKFKEQFHVLEYLGAATFGDVFKVEKNSTSEKYSIKIIEIITDDKNELYRKLRNFRKIQFIIKNSSILRSKNSWLEIDSFSNKLFLYVQTKLFDENLIKFMKDLHKYPILKNSYSLTSLGYYLASNVFIDILNGVYYLHQLIPSLIHKNLKPQNILLRRSEGFAVKLSDFDSMIFKEFCEKSKSHSTDLKNRKYIAPEIADGEEYSTKSDVFSLGIILQELFDIDLNKDCVYYDNGLESYYLQIENIIRMTTNGSPVNRPECETIIDEQYLWSLDKNELNIREEVRIFMDSEKEEESYVHFTISSMSKEFIDNESRIELIKQRRKFYLYNEEHLKDSGQYKKKNNKNTFEDIFKNNSLISYGSLRNNYLTELLQNGKFENSLEIIRMIGKGIYGKVFQVRDKLTSEMCAMKKIKINSSRRVKRYFKNFEKFRTINDSTNEKRLLKFNNVWLERKPHSENFFFFIRMELCDENLENFIKKFHNDTNFRKLESLTPSGYSFASDIFLEILEGVNYLHKQTPETTHRNLKPQNILFKQEINSIFVKIADITTFPNFDERFELIDDKEKVYIAPEVLNFKKYDTRADVYSLGVIMRELFLIDLNKNYIDFRNYSDIACKSSLLMSKYREAKKFSIRMTNQAFDERSDCELLIKYQHLWALNLNEFQINTDKTSDLFIKFLVSQRKI